MTEPTAATSAVDNVLLSHAAYVYVADAVAADLPSTDPWPHQYLYHHHEPDTTYQRKLNDAPGTTRSTNRKICHGARGLSYHFLSPQFQIWR